jgi:hypothetical protein
MAMPVNAAFLDDPVAPPYNSLKDLPQSTLRPQRIKKRKNLCELCGLRGKKIM